MFMFTTRKQHTHNQCLSFKDVDSSASLNIADIHREVLNMFNISELITLRVSAIISVHFAYFKPTTI